MIFAVEFARTSGVTPIQLLLFDFDGTLVDTAPDLVRTTNLLLQAHGIRPLPGEAIRKEIGYGLKTLLRDTIPSALTDAEHFARLEAEFLQIYEYEMLKSPSVFPGAREFLEEWPGEVAIVSNKRVGHILPILKQVGLDRIAWSSIIGGDSFETMKPHARPFLEAMKQAGTDVAETLMVGDGEPDIEGASSLRMRSVAVSFGYSPIERLVHLGATTTIHHYSELRPTIEKLTTTRAV